MFDNCASGCRCWNRSPRPGRSAGHSTRGRGQGPRPRAAPGLQLRRLLPARARVRLLVLLLGRSAGQLLSRLPGVPPTRCLLPSQRARALLRLRGCPGTRMVCRPLSRLPGAPPTRCLLPSSERASRRPCGCPTSRPACIPAACHPASAHPPSDVRPGCCLTVHATGCRLPVYPPLGGL